MNKSKMSIQYRDNILYSKFVPRHYRFQSFEELRDAMVDHPEIYSYLTDETQALYNKWCLDNEFSPFQEYNQDNGKTEDYVIAKIQRKLEIEEEYLRQSERMVDSCYLINDDDGAGAHQYWLEFEGFVIELSGTPSTALKALLTQQASSGMAYINGGRDDFMTYAQARWPTKFVYYKTLVGIDYVANAKLTDVYGMVASAADLTIMNLRGMIYNMLTLNAEGVQSSWITAKEFVSRDYQSGSEKGWLYLPATHMDNWGGGSFVIPDGYQIEAYYTSKINPSRNSQNYVICNSVSNNQSTGFYDVRRYLSYDTGLIAIPMNICRMFTDLSTIPNPDAPKFKQGDIKGGIQNIGYSFGMGGSYTGSTSPKNNVIKIEGKTALLLESLDEIMGIGRIGTSDMKVMDYAMMTSQAAMGAIFLAKSMSHGNRGNPQLAREEFRSGALGNQDLSSADSSAPKSIRYDNVPTSRKGFLIGTKEYFASMYAQGRTTRFD